MKIHFDQDELRAWAGAILLIFGVCYIFVEKANANFEWIMIGLAAFLVGGSILGPKNPVQ